MTSSTLNPGLRVKDVRCTDDELIVSIADGRTISVPLVWYPRLLAASPEQRGHWEVAGANQKGPWHPSRHPSRPQSRTAGPFSPRPVLGLASRG
jgi:hypothetical protein